MYKTMHEENFLCSWLREDGEDKERKLEAENEEEMDKERTREEEKEENETVGAEMRCVGFMTAEAFDVFSQGENLESCGGVSWEDRCLRRMKARGKRIWRHNGVSGVLGKEG